MKNLFQLSHYFFPFTITLFFYLLSEILKDIVRYKSTENIHQTRNIKYCCIFNFYFVVLYNIILLYLGIKYDYIKHYIY